MKEHRIYEYERIRDIWDISTVACTAVSRNQGKARKKKLNWRTEMGYLEKSLAFVIIFLVLRAKKAYCSDCSVSPCSPQGPRISFPFWKVGQPQHCGYPGFKLSCKGNQTVLQLASFGEVFVTSIYYEQNELTIDVGPNNCTYDFFLRFNSSATPFSYYPYFHPENPQYTYMNCSSNITSDDLYPVPCMSSTSSKSGFYVYIVPSAMQLTMLPGKQHKAFDNSFELDYYLGFLSILLTILRRTTGICTGSLFLVAVTAAIISAYYLRRRGRKKGTENQTSVERFLEEYKSLRPARYSYADIKKITDHFKSKLGEGGFGSVFKGTLPSGLPVAVKVLKKNTGGGDGGEFVNEVGTIGRIHHVNIVRLLGFCADGLRRALIYEFMPNESLEKFISSSSRSGEGGPGPNAALSWSKLLDIAVGIARGMEYLHQGCNQRILHFDIKPHNILLDHNFSPKISDFGLAKLCSKERSIVSISAARGTVGYIAPEVLSRNFGNVSYKSDVYSFGMLLLEMAGGRDIIINKSNGMMTEAPLLESIYNNNSCLCGTLTAGDEEDEATLIARKLTIVGLWCVQWHPVDRPCMKVVVQMLEGSVQSLQVPPDPFASLGSAPQSELA
ncbi:Glycerophosphodiester phosphodiesterase protein kinase domain-containing GDPDL2, partial [Ananas comosus]